MDLPKVPDTIQLRGKYHVKIRVDSRIRGRWGGKDVYQKSLRTSDAAIAAREVLRLCDFEDRDGHWSMQITDEGEGMRAKSGSTVRWVPVHPKLLDVGLREHIEARREEVPADALAFNQWERYAKRLGDLQPDTRGRVSGDYGKRFAHLRGEVLKITGGNVAFHSFRHRLQDAADNAGIPDSHRRYLTGRANKDAVEGGYGEGAAMRYLFESLRKIDPLAP